MIKIGVCGFGTVGRSFVDHFLKYKQKISQNCNSQLALSLIADRSIESKKFEDNEIVFSSNVLDVIESDCDLIIELIGGTEISKEIVIGSMNKGKSVITANKALLALHGDELFKIANKNNVYLGFEASVAGAIPVIKTLVDSLSNEKISSITGILNGTCNYILDQMHTSNKSFSDSLVSAQKLGYAESDPSFDVGGNDAAHKISILAILAFKIKSPFNEMFIDGIESIELMDIYYADELGYKIKHIASSKSVDEQIECNSYPALIPNSHILSNIDGVMNAVLIKGDRFGTSMLYGHGAGGDATASAVVSNIKDFCNFKTGQVNSHSIYDLKSRNRITSIGELISQYYLRIFAKDVPGVMAEITSTLASHNISIEAVTQHEPVEENELIPIVIITNSVEFKSIESAISQISRLENIHEKIQLIRVFNESE